MTEPDRTISREDALRRLGVSDRTLSRMIADGRLRTAGVDGRQKLLDADEVERLAEESAGAVTQEEAARILGRDARTIRRWLAEGRLEAAPLVTGRDGVSRASAERLARPEPDIPTVLTVIFPPEPADATGQTPDQADKSGRTESEPDVTGHGAGVDGTALRPDVDADLLDDLVSLEAWEPAPRDDRSRGDVGHPWRRALLAGGGLIAVVAVGLWMARDEESPVLRQPPRITAPSAAEPAAERPTAATTAALTESAATTPSVDAGADFIEGVGTQVRPPREPGSKPADKPATSKPQDDPAPQPAPEPEPTPEPGPTPDPDPAPDPAPAPDPDPPAGDLCQAAGLCP